MRSGLIETWHHMCYFRCVRSTRPSLQGSHLSSDDIRRVSNSLAGNLGEYLRKNDKVFALGYLNFYIHLNSSAV